MVKSLPNLSMLNGVSTSDIVESGKHVVDTALMPRLPEWNPMDPLPEKLISAMWLYLMTYRLADEEKIDETPVWYDLLLVGSILYLLPP
jgi:tubulin--tyrosine ligase-like protein 12